MWAAATRRWEVVVPRRPFCDRLESEGLATFSVAAVERRRHRRLRKQYPRPNRTRYQPKGVLGVIFFPDLGSELDMIVFLES